MTTLKDAVAAYVLNCRRCYGYTPDAREVAAALRLRDDKMTLVKMWQLIKEAR